MRKSDGVLAEFGQIETVDMLAQAFKGISGHHIATIKDQTLSSKQFFADLWEIYTQLKVTAKGHPLRRIQPKYQDKIVFVVVTAEGGLSGDIDKKLVDWMLTFYDKKTTDIIVLGHHGVLQLAQVGIDVTKYYPLPDKDVTTIDTTPIIADILDYGTIRVFYQTYVTLFSQDITSIDLLQAVQTLGDESQVGTVTITSQNYIFEPTFNQVIDHMESIMMSVALSQVILESKLAQYASRFNAMSMAHEKAGATQEDLRRSYNQARRSEDDERTREIINGRKGRIAYGR